MNAGSVLSRHLCCVATRQIIVVWYFTASLDTNTPTHSYAVVLLILLIGKSPDITSLDNSFYCVYKDNIRELIEKEELSKLVVSGDLPISVKSPCDRQ